jgi:tRNA dimethylallyltransferase
MNKLLIISGPTATGKTDLAIKLAKKFDGELISADSRQLYKGMDIGTGKDHPKNIKIHLVDIIKPNESFSVANYQKQAKEKIKDIQSKGKLPIIVGGTGLYINSIIDGKTDTFLVKPNRLLRFVLNRVPTSFIQNIYRIINPKDFSQLNNSEKNNPHRLIRKIEIKLFSKKSLLLKGDLEGFDYFHITLTAPNDFLYKRIDNRVEKRLKMGLLKEIKDLLNKYNWSDPGLNTLAYKEFMPYFKSHTSGEKLEELKNESINRWKFDEHAYARRQKTWFKKSNNTLVVDISKNDIFQNILEATAQWYNKL